MLTPYHGACANDTCEPKVVRMNKAGAESFNKLEQELGFIRMKNRELNRENKRLKSGINPDLVYAIYYKIASSTVYLLYSILHPLPEKLYVGDLNEQKKEALIQYRNDNVFHQQVDMLVSEIMGIIKENV